MTLLLFVSFSKEVKAQGCNQNGIGDVKCAPTAPKLTPSGNLLSFPGLPSPGTSNPLGILGSGSGTPLSFPSTVVPPAGLINTGSIVEAMHGMNCGGGEIDDAHMSLAQSMAALHSLSPHMTPNNPVAIASDICQQIAGGADPNEKGEIADIDVDSEAAKSIAQCAYDELGVSTAEPKGDEAAWYSDLTQDGALGCALAVSRILNCSGYSVGTHVSTVALDKALINDPCYEEIDSGYITAEDAMGLQPGDVLVTRKGNRAGHTGVYVGNGKIISNASDGFNGSDPGTVQQNYTVTDWNGEEKSGGGGCKKGVKGVICRNPSHSAVYRRKDDC